MKCCTFHLHSLKAPTRIFPSLSLFFSPLFPSPPRVNFLSRALPATPLFRRRMYILPRADALSAGANTAAGGAIPPLSRLPRSLSRPLQSLATDTIDGASPAVSNRSTRRDATQRSATRRRGLSICSIARFVRDTERRGCICVINFCLVFKSCRRYHLEIKRDRETKREREEENPIYGTFLHVE